MSSTTPLPPSYSAAGPSRDQKPSSQEVQLSPPSHLSSLTICTHPAPSLCTQKAKEALIGNGYSTQSGKVPQPKETVTQTDVEQALQGDPEKAHLLYMAAPFIQIVDTLGPAKTP